MQPSFWDKFRLKFSPSYLYPGQMCSLRSKVYAGILHKTPDLKLGWKIMDHRWFLANTTLKYWGKGHQLTRSDFDPHSSLFEVVNAIIDNNLLDPTHVSPGDIICIAPSDRQYIARLVQK